MDILTNGSYIKKNGWSSDEDECLKHALSEAADAGLPLRAAFEKTARSTGRKPGSVRNHYYSEIRPKDAPGREPFATFTESEIRDLLHTVLSAQAKGQSVRKCTLQMSSGDKSAMLRYQNKYRSLLRTHPDLVQDVMQEMAENNIPCHDPYSKNRLYTHIRTESGQTLAPECIAFAGLLTAQGRKGRALMQAIYDIIGTDAVPDIKPLQS